MNPKYEATVFSRKNSGPWYSTDRRDCTPADAAESYVREHEYTSIGSSRDIVVRDTETKKLYYFHVVCHMTPSYEAEALERCSVVGCDNVSQDGVCGDCKRKGAGI